MSLGRTAVPTERQPSGRGIRPNVVLVLTDDQGYPELGCHGNPLIRTPHMDALHGEGVRFEQFHVGPTCAPTRAGILTGHHANSTGVWHTIGGRSLLRENEWTLAAALKEAGYRTGLFGKWHLGDEYPFRPQDRGFDESVSHGGGGISQSPDWWGNDYFDDTYRVNGEPRNFEGYCTDVFFREAQRFIETYSDEPFFCMITPNAPHSPFNVPKADLARYDDVDEPETYRRFMAMVSNIDDNLGRLRKRLEQLGLTGNTLFLFMSDNGTTAEAWEGREQPYRAGMRGEKGSEYEGGHRVPCFVSWPDGGVETNVSVQELTAYVDVMPTILDLCGIDVPPERSFHGKSLAGLLRGKGDASWKDRVLVTDSQRVPYPVKWKQSAVMKGAWRLINGRELYDLGSDPAQESNIADAHPGLVGELRTEYEAWWDLVSTQFDEEIPIRIGEGAPVCLNTHDWRNESCDAAWHQGMIREGKVCNGYWEVFIEADGDYAFELRRWPREAGHALQKGIDGDDVAWRREECWPAWHGAYTGGRALPLRTAQLAVDGQELQVTDVQENAEAVRFVLSLQQGPSRVQTWFSDGKGLVMGAYYVYVQKIG